MKVQKLLRFTVYSACAVLCVRGTEGHDSAEFSRKIPHATLIEDENFARFRSVIVQKPKFWHNDNEKCYVVPSESAKVRGQI